MLTREYDFIVVGNHCELVVEFKDSGQESLTDFFAIEIRQYYRQIRDELKQVLIYGKKESSFAGNMLEVEFDRKEAHVLHLLDYPDLPKDCYLPTIDLYRLVEEYILIEKKMLERTIELPLTISNGDWLWNHWVLDYYLECITTGIANIEIKW